MASENYDSNFASGHNLKNDLMPQLKITYRRTDELKASKHQVRQVKPKHVKRAARSIERFGFCEPVLVNGDEVVDGHVRLKAALELGLENIPTIDVSHLDDDEIRLVRIALNKIQEQGTWDDFALKLEFAYQLEINTNLSVTGFDAWEIDAVLEIGEAVEGGDDGDQVVQLPDPNASSVSQTGDLWQLGKHLILCGNARSKPDVTTLVNGKPISMCFTDVPFNVPNKGHVTSSSHHPEFLEAHGELSSPGYEDFLALTLGHASEALKPGGLLYTFIDWRHTKELSAALERIGLEQIQLCVWVKDHPGMGSFYRSQHELVYVVKKPGAAHCNNIMLGAHGRNRSNVWQFPGATGGKTDDADDFKSHPTVKPLKLIDEALLDVTGAGDVVLDPFLGSGSTLLAAERMQRRCLGLEISPAYVDLAIRRWQAMTGEEAVHVESGKTYDERAVEQPQDDHSAQGDF
ncbi:DNA modification methylase [uncultured Roseovarius sp.]|uniref:DNA modification methylase n=1 Tax=uncultured Roseovarius sp. TaxID=293344 RepID=UPI0025D24D57|nr:DNA modification methylase [uncultured Roseovarius sp.]